MAGNQIAAIIFAVISFTFASKQLATEPQYNLPPPQPAEVRIVLEDSALLGQSERKAVKEVVVKQSPVFRVEPPKNNTLTGPALLITLALLVFGNGG